MHWSTLKNYDLFENVRTDEKQLTFVVMQTQKSRSTTSSIVLVGSLNRVTVSFP